MSKSERITLRLPASDAEALRAVADEDGCSVSECVRARVAGRRARPRRSATEAERQQLAQVLAAVGKIGGNVNQLAYHANQGETVAAGEIEALRAELEAWRDALVAALPDRP
jgi:hypothetical protein